MPAGRRPVAGRQQVEPVINIEVTLTVDGLPLEQAAASAAS